jgi:carbonic anhydrase/acetyltransferase-like protein (isoleucine patch superfamily)
MADLAKMLRASQGFYYAPNALIAGDVQIGADSSVWFNAVVRGDVAPIRIGARVNVQDGAIIHCDSGRQQVIEDEVSIGHQAVVHCVRVGEGTLIGMGAHVLGRSTIGRECIIAAGAVVPEGMEVPDRSVVMGVPGRIRRGVTDEELRYIRWISPHYVALAQRWANGEFRSLV